MARLQGRGVTEESEITWLSCLGDQEHLAHLHMRAGTRGSATRREQDHLSQLAIRTAQRRAALRGSAQEESRNTWLGYRVEQEHVAHQYRR